MPRPVDRRSRAPMPQSSIRWSLLTILMTVLMGGMAAVAAPRLALGGETPDLLAASTAVVSGENVALFAGYVTSIPSDVAEFEAFNADPDTSIPDGEVLGDSLTPPTTAPPAPPPSEASPPATVSEASPNPSPTTPPPTSDTTAPAPPPPPTTAPSLGGPDASAEAGFVSRINSVRSGAGQPGLARSGALDAYARSWAQQMATSATLAHSGLGGGPYGSFAMTGENVGVGGNVDLIFSALAGSGPHLTNMTHPGFTHVGVGVWIDGNGQMWTAHVFGG
ncbi:MAG: CAP domain-containing protein [Acidimicrobiia bacterium]|nr:CAP domain-containing protein [Acidimicrobiia bacterium]